MLQRICKSNARDARGSIGGCRPGPGLRLPARLIVFKCVDYRRLALRASEAPCQVPALKVSVANNQKQKMNRKK
jgi:hypothetical protein